MEGLAETGEGARSHRLVARPWQTKPLSRRGKRERQPDGFAHRREVEIRRGPDGRLQRWLNCPECGAWSEAPKLRVTCGARECEARARAVLSERAHHFGRLQ